MSVFYTDKFEKAVDYVLSNEGGYICDKDDAGGETKYGISKRSYPNLDIKELTIDDAKKIYFCDFWCKGKFELISNNMVATQIFDLSVNLGVRAAVVILQRALWCVGKRVLEDGIMGQQTLFATNNSSPDRLVSALKSEAAGYYRMLARCKPAQEKFLTGWLNRAYKQFN